ncbi:tyrosine-type recombinase/integrase [Streptomyces sp. CBMA29]|uniref:tyrosine-type recombinase/integrase n=1 Tax=Streptomyces sp. CBMA29 TaxID=1896314 RepID=UPI001661C195|nr:site-specific integrase [Streptomyces sp. CBMA29]MBD0740553.1 integrase [Streptomyces sp. CBMA29]
MANIQKRPNGKWRARYRDPNGKEHSRHFDRKVDAQRWLDEVTASVLTGQYVDPKSAKRPFKEYAEQWRSSQPHRPSTARAVEQHLRCHAYPAWDGRTLGGIKPGDIQSWITGLTTTHGLAASTARTVFNTVNAVFTAAVRDRMISNNPCTGAKLPTVPRKRIVPLTVPQVRNLAGQIAPPYKGLVLLTAATGLRPGEVFGLQRRHLDLSQAALTVDQQVQQTKHGVFVGPPKTDRSYRVVPLPKMAADAMKAHLKVFPAPGPQDWLFTAPQGGAVAYNEFMKRVWRPACRKAGIPDGIGPHALRHHYASLLIKHGESVKTVSERLGHTNAAMTLNIYTHLWPDSEERTRAAIDKAYTDSPDDGNTPPPEET